MTCAPSKIPTLPDPREEDIPDLIKHFVEIYGRRVGKQIECIPEETMSAFDLARLAGQRAAATEPD